MAGTSASEQASNAKALDEGLRRLNTVLRAAYSPETTAKVLLRTGTLMRTRLVQELSKPGSGVEYARGKKTHTASAPGEPPAVDTGRLRSSITVVPGADARGPYVDVGTNVMYASMLEFGTRNMRPRPFFRPVITELRATMTARLASAIAANVRAAASRAGGR